MALQALLLASDVIASSASNMAPMADMGSELATSVLNSLVPMVAIVTSFGVPLLVVIAVLVYRFRRQRLINDVILKLAEKGQTVPPELFVEPVRQRSELRRALTWIMVGLGLIVFGAFDGDRDVIGIGFIPLLIGIGFFVAYKLEKKDGPAAGS
ncbi:MAG: hypothetical protein KGJ55_03790 [Gammaproteobacteria bacterium]|nr:hypothetical protein [Gammaproteobacteria bacterium]